MASGTQVIPFVPVITGIVRCGRSNKAFAAEPQLANRWCLNDANHDGMHIAGLGMSWEREMEREQTGIHLGIEQQ